MSTPRFTWDSRDMSSTQDVKPGPVVGGIQENAESNYERGYKAGYAQATADILKTIKEHYGE